MIVNRSDYSEVNWLNIGLVLYRGMARMIDESFRVLSNNPVVRRVR
jgi:hypothetical protein